MSNIKEMTTFLKSPKAVVSVLALKTFYKSLMQVFINIIFPILPCTNLTGDIN